VNKALALQLWNPRKALAIKCNNIELNESDKAKVFVLVHVAKGYIFTMIISFATT
jgi:hypothetical protein